MLIRLSPITSSPTLHSLLPFVEAAVQPMPPLQSADVSLATCAPLLAPLEPELLLHLLALFALG